MIHEVLGQQRRMTRPKRKDVWLESGNLLVLKGGTFRHHENDQHTLGRNDIRRGGLVGHHKGWTKQGKNLETFRPSPRVVMQQNPRQPRIIRYQTPREDTANNNNKQRRGIVRDSHQSAVFTMPSYSLFNSSPFMGYSYERRK